jgi:hypothetical protein
MVCVVHLGSSAYPSRGTSNKKALSTDQPNMQNFKFALGCDESTSASEKKGVWPGTTIGDAASFPFDVHVDAGDVFRSA